jgi:hypothetical protein
VPFRTGVPVPQNPWPKLRISIGVPKSTVLPFQLTSAIRGSTTASEKVMVLVGGLPELSATMSVPGGALLTVALM